MTHYYGDPGFSSVYAADPYSGVERASSMYTSSNADIAGAAGAPLSYSASMAGLVAPVKRSSEGQHALYHQAILGTHNTIGQEGLYSAISLNKRTRLETESNLPAYPQRPGEQDCAYYMMTRTCKFGYACKFDHPLWVPEGGIPDWKEVPVVHSTESLPMRPGEPDCPYFVKTQRCKFGYRCKFNHPKGIVHAVVNGTSGAEAVDDFVLPQRPSEPVCSFYAKTGKCNFGKTCKFHHPMDIRIPSIGQGIGGADMMMSNVTGSFVASTPAMLHNTKGLPIRLGETDCPFYLKTGSCKYGAACRFNHPERYFNPAVALALSQGAYSSAAANVHMGFLSSAANFPIQIDPNLAHTSYSVAPSVYPQRPGQLECDFYMKTGQCKFSENCKFHHPIDRSAPLPAGNHTVSENVKLTLAGLPRREGMVACPYYMKTGACKYGAACRFDHPPPGEAVAMASEQA